MKTFNNVTKINFMVQDQEIKRNQERVKLFEQQENSTVEATINEAILDGLATKNQSPFYN